jgi:hypothetical protein
MEAASKFAAQAAPVFEAKGADPYEKAAVRQIQHATAVKRPTHLRGSNPS